MFGVFGLCEKAEPPEPAHMSRAEYDAAIRFAEAHGYLAALSNLCPFLLTFFGDVQEAMQPHRVKQAQMIEQQIKLSRNALGPEHPAYRIADH